MIVGLSAGAGTLMGICAILAWLSNRVSNLESSKSTLDKASYAASILTLVTLPLAMFSGYYSVSDPTGSAIFYNKFIFSGIAIGFTSSYIAGRIRYGAEIWDHPALANLQMLSALFGLTSIMILGSIGSKITLGESTLDILPLWPEFMNSIVINQWVSLFLVIIGVSSVIISFKMMDSSNKSQI
jgi:protein-S-isoprenylcysteine O-methyltransferase Ste14